MKNGTQDQSNSSNKPDSKKLIFFFHNRRNKLYLFPRNFAEPNSYKTLAEILDDLIISYVKANRIGENNLENKSMIIHDYFYFHFTEDYNEKIKLSKRFFYNFTLFDFYTYQMPERDIKETLKLCRKLPESYHNETCTFILVLLLYYFYMNMEKECSWYRKTTELLNKVGLKIFNLENENGGSYWISLLDCFLIVEKILNEGNSNGENLLHLMVFRNFENFLDDKNILQSYRKFCKNLGISSSNLNSIKIFTESCPLLLRTLGTILEDKIIQKHEDSSNLDYHSFSRFVLVRGEKSFDGMKSKLFFDNVNHLVHMIDENKVNIEINEKTSLILYNDNQDNRNQDNPLSDLCIMIGKMNEEDGIFSNLSIMDNGRSSGVENFFVLHSDIRKPILLANFGRILFQKAMRE